MAYDWADIKSRWLGEGRISMPQPRVVDAFTAAEMFLGREWVEKHRVKDGVVLTGALPTLAVAGTGAQLQAVQNAAGFPELLERLRTGEAATYSELMASFLCERGLTEIRLEYGTSVLVGDRIRRPDFRVARASHPWIYVEVTAPNRSEANQRAQKLIAAIGEGLMALPSGTTIEVLLLRYPSNEESGYLVETAIALAATKRTLTKEVDDLAVITVNRLPPGIVEPQDHGRNLGPVLGFARAFGQGGRPDKHVSVRIPVTDQRAVNFLTTEAQQLPTHEPGLIMMDMNSVPGGFKEWEDLLVHHLQPTIQTRVSAICLFFSSIRLTAEGEALTPEMRLIENSHATLALPKWLQD